MPMNNRITRRPGLPAPEAMNSAIETLELLLRKTEENGHTIALIYPDESGDFIRGYTAGQIDAFRLALDHIKDMEENYGYEKRR